MFLSVIVLIQGPNSPEIYENPLEAYAFVFLLLGWSIAAQIYKSKEYKGGITTYVGGFIAGLSVFEFVGVFLWKSSNLEEHFVGYIILSLIFFAVGVALLLQGHKFHKMQIINKNT